LSFATKPLPLRKAVIIVAGAIVATLVALLVAAAVGVSQANASAVQVPTRTILVIDSGKGVVVEADVPPAQADQVVRVDGVFLHVNLNAESVKEQGWKISKSPIDSKSPIQAYNLSPTN